jgi:ferric-dicitrate binding protein FerR (iron transport regulator)
LDTLENYKPDFEELIHRFLVRKATPDEVKLLQDMVKAKAENKKTFEIYRDIWMASQKTRIQSYYDEQKAWEELKKKILPQKNSVNTSDGGKIRTLRILVRAAAIFIPAFCAGLLVIYFSAKSSKSSKSDQQITYTEYKVPYGSKSEIILPDKSKVWLNSGTTLKYSNQFNQSFREVYLEGECFFDVTKNTNKPFLVLASGVTVKVLGTAFNVKAYPEEKTVETTVERGLVQVASNDKSRYGEQKVLIHAMQKATLERVETSTSEQKVKIAVIPDSASSVIDMSLKKSINVSDNVDVVSVVSWKEKNWIIEREDLQSLAIKIERRYNVEIEFSDNELKHFVFSGVLKDESLEQVLNAIKLSAPIGYTINQKKVKLYHK